MQKLSRANVNECIPLEIYKTKKNHFIFIYVYMTFFQSLGEIGRIKVKNNLIMVCGIFKEEKKEP